MTVSAEAIEILNAEGHQPYSYSGRYMYGKRCVAVNVEHHKDLFMLDRLFVENGFELDPPEMDQMGLGYVAYWPSLDWPQEREAA